MVKVEIYTKSYCPYCVKAKGLLVAKGVKFTEIDVENDQEKFAEMMKKSEHARTVPQIFINDAFIGGYDDLHALDNSGDLDGMLGKE